MGMLVPLKKHPSVLGCHLPEPSKNLATPDKTGHGRNEETRIPTPGDFLAPLPRNAMVSEKRSPASSPLS